MKNKLYAFALFITFSKGLYPVNDHKTVDTTWFKECLKNTPLVQKINDIKLIVCDVDGSLTNAGIYVTNEGEGGRIFSIQDGYIFRPLMNAGITLSLMSGKNNTSTLQRGRMLGVPDDLCIVGMLDKPPATKQLQERFNLTPPTNDYFWR